MTEVTTWVVGKQGVGLMSPFGGVRPWPRPSGAWLGRVLSSCPAPATKAETGGDNAPSLRDR